MPLLAAAMVVLLIAWVGVPPAQATEPKQPLFAALGLETVDGRQGAVAAPLPDGRVLIAGGSDDTALRSAEIFDYLEVSFEPVADLTRYKRTRAVAAPLPDGRVLIAGGSNEVPYAHAEIFDPATEEFSDVEDEMTISRSSAMAAPLPDGRVLIAGGRADVQTLATAETFDPESETFTPLAASMVRARYGAVATALPSGKVLFVGGYGESGPASSAEAFDPATGRFETVIPHLGRDVLNAAGVALPNGTALVAGGTLGGFAVRSADLIDPVSPSFVSLPNSGGTRLTTERNNAIAASLPDGKVLISGGSWPDARSSAEIFVPASSLAAAGGEVGSRVLGGESAPATVVVTSLGGWDLELDGVSLAGPDAGDFAILADSCTETVLDFEEICTLSIRFTPARLGTAEARLVFDSNEPVPTEVPLTATGVAAPFVPAPTVPAPLVDPPAPRNPISVKCGAEPIARSKRAKVTCRVNPGPGAWEARLRHRGRTVARRQLTGGSPRRLVFRVLRRQRGGYRLALRPLP